MVADVEMACNPFRDSRVYRPRGMLIQFHRVLLLSAGGLYSLEHASLYGLGRALMHLLLERVRPLPPSASVVRIDPTDAHPAAI